MKNFEYTKGQTFRVKKNTHPEYSPLSEQSYSFITEQQ
jgi:hypothetical protein